MIPCNMPSKVAYPARMRRRCVSLGLVLVLGGCASSGSSSSTQTKAATPAMKLADLSDGNPHAAHDPLVVAFNRGLNTLRTICKQRRERTAEIVWSTWQDLKKNHRPTTLLHVLRALHHVGGALPRRARPTDCVQLLAAYAVLVERPNGKP